jgi:hypothetical protein
MPKKASQHPRRDVIGRMLERTALRWPDEPPPPIAPDESPAGPDQTVTSTPSRRPRIRRRPRPWLDAKTPHGPFVLSTVLFVLNCPPHPLDGHPSHPRHRDVRAVVDHLIQGNLQEAVETFNRYFGDEQTALRLHYFDSEDGYYIREDPTPTHISTALRAWLLSAEPQRLKQCRACPIYFFDRTKPRNRHYCSPACQSRITSQRSRRRK